MEYIPEDMEKNFLKESSFTILEAMYPVGLLELIKAAFMTIKAEHNNGINDMIEETEKAKRK